MLVFCSIFLKVICFYFTNFAFTLSPVFITEFKKSIYTYKIRLSKFKTDNVYHIFQVKCLFINTSKKNLFKD